MKNPFGIFQNKLLVKSLRIMKLSLLLMMVFSAGVFAEGISQKKINLSFNNKEIEQVFGLIEKQTDYRFLYKDNLEAVRKKVSLQVKDAALADVLKKLLLNTGLKYELQNGELVVIMEEVFFAAPADEKVTGIVTDEAGLPLENVSVSIKNGAGVSTDKTGRYTITVPSDKTILTFSFVGYTSEELEAGNSGQLNVSLKTITNKLNDVIVVGYGTQRQKDLTGAVSTISSKGFNRGPVMSPQQAIQGKLAGVNISQNSGKPGGSNTIRIRGGTSLTGSNDPLYVIDGVPISTSAGVAQANIRGNGTDVFDQEPTNPLMTLNPDDIESVTVLKDASATAIYGSRGANGVIVITTKKGIAGNAKVTFGASTGLSKVANTLDVLSADQYRDEINKLGLPLDDKGSNTNWQDQIYRTAVSQDYNLALSGGSAKTTYRASLGYGKQEGIMIGSDLKRANARININHAALNDRLLFDMRVNYGQTASNSAPVSNTVGSEAGTSMNYESYVFNPTYPIYDANGNFNHVRPYRVNPVSFSTDVLDELTNNRFLGNLSTTLKILKPLSFNVNLGYTKQNINRNSYIAKSNILGEGLGGYASVQKLEDYSRLLETVIRFNNKFGSHTIDAIAGYSHQYFVNEGDRSTASGFLSDEFKWYSLQAARTVGSVNTFKQSNTLISFYGRINYNFDDRFLVTGTLRRDGSSRFGEGNKWGMFPSGSVAWRLSNEKFFHSNVFNDVKLRVSYGTTGNQEIGNLNSITTLGATNTGYIIGGERITTVLPQQYANPNLRWEQTAQFNAGVDFAMFKSRFHGSIDYYIKKTTDLLLRLPVPSPTAVSTQLANVGSVQNKGIEVDLGGTLIDKKDFTWESNINVSWNKNEVLSLSNDQYKGNNIQIAPLQGAGLSGVFAQLIMPGQPLGTFYGRSFLGIKGGKEELSATDTIIGNAQPDFIFGFNNTFSYKNFSLAFTLRGSVGNDVFNLTGNNLGYTSNLPGRNVFVSAVTSGVGRDQPKRYSSRWIEDGSFARLDNITLAYNIPLKSLKFVSGARVYLTGQNLLLITNYSGLDPEVNSEISGTGVAPLGVDYLAYPRAKTVSLGLTVNF
ncbi:MAG: TonB-dependent receptor [Bacteroidota bacterium]